MKLDKIDKFFYGLISLFSILIILSALFIEHVLLVQACKLCLYQRIPYIVLIIISFLGYFFSNKRIWIYLIILTLLVSIVISGYHLGIENGIFAEFSGCTNESLNTINKSDLLKSLNNFLPSCKDVNFELFGLSLATINFLISIALTLITIRYLHYEKNR